MAGQCPARSESWWLLDYELLGEVRVPLYDAFHLVRTSCRLRGSTAGSWIAQLLEDTPDSVAARRILRRAIDRLRLSPDQAIAALAHYLVDFATRLHRRALPSAFWAPVVADAERLAHVMTSRGTIANDFTDSAGLPVSDSSCAALPVF
jgi:hypothetical protein